MPTYRALDAQLRVTIALHRHACGVPMAVHRPPLWKFLVPRSSAGLPISQAPGSPRQPSPHPRPHLPASGASSAKARDIPSLSRVGIPHPHLEKGWVRRKPGGPRHRILPFLPSPQPPRPCTSPLFVTPAKTRGQHVTARRGGAGRPHTRVILHPPSPLPPRPVALLAPLSPRPVPSSCSRRSHGNVRCDATLC